MKGEKESTKACLFEPAYLLALPRRGGEGGGEGRERKGKENERLKEREVERERESRGRKEVENCSKDEWSKSEKRGENETKMESKWKRGA